MRTLKPIGIPRQIFRHVFTINMPVARYAFRHTDIASGLFHGKLNPVRLGLGKGHVYKFRIKQISILDRDYRIRSKLKLIKFGNAALGRRHR